MCGAERCECCETILVSSDAAIRESVTPRRTQEPPLIGRVWLDQSFRRLSLQTLCSGATTSVSQQQGQHCPGNYTGYSAIHIHLRKRDVGVVRRCCQIERGRKSPATIPQPTKIHHCRLPVRVARYTSAELKIAARQTTRTAECWSIVPLRSRASLDSRTLTQLARHDEAKQALARAFKLKSERLIFRRAAIQMTMNGSSAEPRIRKT